MDQSGRADGAHPLTVAGIDLHLHSTASDGSHGPADVVRLAAEAGLTTVALTDHDTLDGLPAARDAGRQLGVRVVPGCEFSVAAPWGEMHLLGYFLPEDSERLDAFLAGQRDARTERMRAIVARLQAGGVRVTFEDVTACATGHALGRPHAARALLARGTVRTLQEAFDRFLGWGRPAFVPKVLPPLDAVTSLIRAEAGVSSAAHLKARGSRSALDRLRASGVDAVEVRHPAHDAGTTSSLNALAIELDLLRSGGTDWHGEAEADASGRARLGSITVPPAWLEALEALHDQRREERR